MFRKKNVITITLGIAAMVMPAFSQSEDPGRNEVSVQALGSFVKSTTSDSVRNSATNSGGVLINYRRFFNIHNGIEVNYGYALNTQNFLSPSGESGVKTNSHEVSGAYVFRLPLKRFTPFVLAGAGALIFDPKDSRDRIRRRVQRSFTVAELVSTSRVACSCALSIAASSTTLQPII
jgi:hypothetical protein